MESSSRLINQLGSLAFVLSAGGGVIHAHLTYVPEAYEERPRPGPEPKPEPKAALRIQPILAPTAGGFVLGFAGAF